MSTMNLKDLGRRNFSIAYLSDFDSAIITKASAMGLVLGGSVAVEFWGSVLGINVCKRNTSVLDFVSKDSTTCTAFLEWLKLEVDPSKVTVNVTILKSHVLKSTYFEEVQGVLVAVPEYLVISTVHTLLDRNIDFIKSLLPVCNFDFLEELASDLKFEVKHFDFLNSIITSLVPLFVKDSKSSGALMLGLLPVYLEDVFGVIDMRDVQKSGVELETHVTVAYGFDTGLYPTFDSLGIDSDVEGFDVVFTGISFFENEQYDVCKFDIESPSLEALHFQLKETLGFESTYDTYHPHSTVAYLHPGSAKKYKPLLEALISTLKFPITVPVTEFFYSTGGLNSIVTYKGQTGETSL